MAEFKAPDGGYLFNVEQFHWLIVKGKSDGKI